MSRLAGKLAIVTGGARGLGEAICRRFVAEGCKVVVMDVDAETGASLVKELGAADCIKVDVSDQGSVAAAFQLFCERHERLDILVNNAGVVGEQKPLAEQSDEEWQRIMRVNLDGAFYVLRAALNIMLKQDTSGCIVNMASICGLIGWKNIGPYTATKGALVSLTRSTAIEYGKKNIRVNALAPTAVLTPMVKEFIDKSPDPKKSLADMEMMNPLPGVPLPEDIAAAALFLASDESRYINGVTLPIDGGYTAR